MVLPIKDADIPVGPNKRHFGLSGLSPGALRILSLHWAVNNMSLLFPVPPGPEMKDENAFMFTNYPNLNFLAQIISESMHF